MLDKPFRDRNTFLLNYDHKQVRLSRLEEPRRDKVPQDYSLIPSTPVARNKLSLNENKVRGFQWSEINLRESIITTMQRKAYQHNLLTFALSRIKIKQSEEEFILKMLSRLKFFQASELRYLYTTVGGRYYQQF